MRSTTILSLLQLVYLTVCKGQLKERFGWGQIDYKFRCPEDRKQAIKNGNFIPENNVPMGIEVYGDRAFVTLLRWRPGVPASLNYFKLNDSSTSPKLIPYPNWAAHSDKGDRREIIAPYRVRADRCNRLWVLDSGAYVNSAKEWIRHAPAFLVYDLNTDKLIRRHEFPEEYIKPKSGYANIVVEDEDCEDTFVYAGDTMTGRMVVYSWKEDKSWKIAHPYFNSDPTACDFEVNGYKFRWSDAIFGMALSKPNANGFSTFYFHPMTSFNEFSVSTEYLRNTSTAETNPNAFKRLGNRGPRTQSGSSFLHKKSGVLFYSLLQLNAIGCWRTTNKVHNTCNQRRVFANNETMIFPSDIKVDYNDNLWVVSNRMPIWRYGSLDPNDVNFRVFSAPVADVIRYSGCDKN